MHLLILLLIYKLEHKSFYQYFQFCSIDNQFSVKLCLIINAIIFHRKQLLVRVSNFDSLRKMHSNKNKVL
jgi:hypothetical protein